MNRNPYGRPQAGAAARWGGGVRLVPIVLFGLYLGYYYLSNQQVVPLTGRTQLVDISREQEAALGFESYREILSQSRVLNSGPSVDLVKQIGRTLVMAVGEDDPGFEWEFNVIESDEVNAFCLPGGKVAVYTGILPVAANPEGLAVVMGHEIAHAIARHGAERMAYQKLLQIGTLAAGVALSDMDRDTQQMVMGALGVGTQFGILLPFSREHESEADYMGLIYLSRACLDPTQAPMLWQRMGERAAGPQPAEFLSTHPSHETRIRQFEGWMPEAVKLRAERCGS